MKHTNLILYFVCVIEKCQRFIGDRAGIEWIDATTSYSLINYLKHGVYIVFLSVYCGRMTFR